MPLRNAMRVSLRLCLTEAHKSLGEASASLLRLVSLCLFIILLILSASLSACSKRPFLRNVRRLQSKHLTIGVTYSGSRLPSVTV